MSLTWDEIVWNRLQQLSPKKSTQYHVTIDSEEVGNAEQSAISAFSWGGPNNQRMIVGGTLRGYSQCLKGGSCWGADIYAIGAPTADVQLCGAEIAAYQRNHANRQVTLGFTTIFGNRLADVPAGGVGENQYNERSWAWFVQGHTRSSLGEYCGWNKVIKIQDFALDRTKTVPYATVIELGEVHSDVILYLVTWKEKGKKFGLRITSLGPVIDQIL